MGEVSVWRRVEIFFYNSISNPLHSFAECKANMESDCEFGRLGWRIDERQIMWDLIDKLKEMHEVTMNAQEARDLSLAEGPDGDAKADAYLKTKAGKKKIKVRTTKSSEERTTTARSEATS